MSWARSVSVAGLSDPSLEPFPPFTVTGFFSAIAKVPIYLLANCPPCGRIADPLLRLVNSCPQRENRHVEGDEHAAHKDGHENQKNRLDQGHGRPQRRLYVFFVKFRHRSEHSRQRTG